MGVKTEHNNKRQGDSIIEKLRAKYAETSEECKLALD